MISKMKSRMLSIFLTLTMAVSVFAVGQVPANAAESAITVTIADVIFKYKEAKAILDTINTYRNQKNLSSLVMNEDLMEKAMVRASELSVYASVARPDGTEYVEDYAQIIGYDVLSNASLINQWKNNSNSNTIMSSSVYQSVGIGVVDVNDYKHVCVLFSADSLPSANSSVLSQSNKTVNQTIKALPSVLSNVKTSFSNNTSLMCGSSTYSYLYVTNKLYPTVGAFLTADNMNVTISNPNCFSYTYNQIKAIYPGESLITITSKENSSVSASATIKAVSISLDGCSFAAIPDQYYTGKAISPNVSGTDLSGNTLILGTDYTVEYSNNIQIGTASVTIKGIGKYAGQTKKLTFNIILNQSSAFSITAKASSASVVLGESTTISVTQSGGVSPIKYTYQYAESNSSSWKSIVSSTTNASCTFKPAEAKSYNVKVTAVDNAGRTASQTVYVKADAKMVCNVALNKTTAAIGETVVITASQQGGTSPTYAYYIKKSSDTSWTTLKDFSNVAYYNYVPISPGEYTVLVKFKSTSGQSDEVYKTFKVTGSALTNKSSVSAVSVALGKSVTLKGAASGGAGSYQYAYYYKLSTETSWTTLEAFGTKTSVSFTPKTVGTYNVCIKVKDSTENIVKKYFTVTCSQSFSNTSTISAAKINLGKSVTVNASSDSSRTCTYAVWYHTKGTASWSTVQNYSSNAKITITPAKSGNFEICVRVKDNSGAIAVKYIDFTVNPKLVNSSKLSASSVETSSAVTVKCAASGGSGTYTYLVQYRKSGTSSWTVKQNYTSNASVSLSFSTAGTYEIGINVKDSLGDIVSATKTLTVKSPIVSKLTIAKSSIVCGQSNNASVSATGGTGGYSYAFYYKKSTSENWITKQDFKSTTKVTMTPSSAGTYDVCVKVKDSSGTVQKAYGTFKVTAAVSVKATLSSSAIVLGQTTKITASASNGSGGYTYAVYYKRPNTSTWITKQSFSSKASVDIKPTLSGTYDVCVKAKDSIGGIAKAFLTITVKPAVSVKASLSASTIVRGQTTKVTLSASNGSEGYTYAVYYKNSASSAWTTKQNFSSNATVEIKPALSGTYDVCVKAKDSIGGIARAYLTITVKPSVENTSKISAASVKLKNSVTVTASAKDGSGGYTYAVLYKKSSSSYWTTVQDFSANTTVKVTPLTATNYDICVKAKDSIGTVSKKYFTVSVTN